MEQQLLDLLTEMEYSIAAHPIEVIRISMIRKMVSIACKSGFAHKLEAELRANEAAHDREKRAKEVTKVSRW
jgi:hypothetical protein